MFYIVILLPILPSIVSYIIIRILENDLSRKLNLYNESLYKIRNIIDAYAFVMKKYDESIEDIRGKILNLSSKESDLEKRLVAIEKLLPALIDLYKEKRSD
jgi:Mg2+ and Co2+ transporter CorA